MHNIQHVVFEPADLAQMHRLLSSKAIELEDCMHGVN